MRKYAIVEENTITKIETLSEDEVRSIKSNVIDIEDTIPQPQVGWDMVGNTLQPSFPTSNDDEMDAAKQTAQRIFGQKLIPTVVDKVGARNLKLSRLGTPVDVAALNNQLQIVRQLLDGGALRTVRGLCVYLKPSFQNHVDIFDYLVAEITNFLIDRGWN